MRILLTGITGQLGFELKHTLAPLGTVIGIDRQDMDLSQPAKIRQVIENHEPDIIVNPAAYTAVDKAETEQELAHTINTEAPKTMADVAQELGATLIHISTDYVFDGAQHTPYLETDKPNPIGIYGKTKLAGEVAVQNSCERSYIFRTAWVYGAYGHNNFVKTMLRLGHERPEVKVVMDQIGTPTSASCLASRITKFVTCLKHSYQTPPESGIYHLTACGAASWYDFAVAIFEEARDLGFPLQTQRIVPITTAEYPTTVRRPAYSILSNQKLNSILGPSLGHWREGLRKTLFQLSSTR